MWTSSPRPLALPRAYVGTGHRFTVRTSGGADELKNDQSGVFQGPGKAAKRADRCMG